MFGITHVYRNIHVGGDPEFCADINADIKTINSMDLVVDVRSHNEGDGWVNHLDGPRHASVIMYDDGRRKNSTQMFYQVRDLVVEVAEDTLQQPEEVGIFVHCHMGINRSPSMVMYLLMEFHGMTPLEAFCTIRETRTCAGLAYAEDAVRAHRGHVSKSFKNFEEDYWDSPKNVMTVNEFIRQNRAIESGKSWVDANGIVHVQGKGKK